MSAAPTVYLLHGDDEVGIENWIGSLREKLGERSTADMNTTRLKGRVDPIGLQAAVRAVPFLAPRRLVILEEALVSMKSKAEREAFLALLEGVPLSTALVIAEGKVLEPKHWLQDWGAGHPDRFFSKAMPLPRGGALVKWVVDYARSEGGEMTPQAAQHLVDLIGDDNRLAAAETDKLMAYVGYGRAIDVDDVDLLTAPVRQADVFKMVDAIGAKNGRLALTMLQDLLATRDAISIFGMIVRQVRLLLLFKEMQAERLPPASVAKELGVRDFVVSKLSGQAANFEIDGLEAIYAGLAGIDDRIKTGRIEPEIALNAFIAEVTSPARSLR
ncbi:MAG TPA: DNA polymerase III subunit delta [Anaerolineales bacterium]|nr:DNA polymerase III subunit delta [Anaerolineales bacterium]